MCVAFTDLELERAARGRITSGLCIGLNDIKEFIYGFGVWPSSVGLPDSIRPPRWLLTPPLFPLSSLA